MVCLLNLEFDSVECGRSSLSRVIAALTELQLIARHSTEPEQKERMRYLEGKVLLLTGRKQDALNRVTGSLESLSTNSARAEALSIRAEIFSAVGKSKAAKDELELAARLVPRGPDLEDIKLLKFRIGSSAI